MLSFDTGALAMAGRTLPELKQLLVYRKKDRGSVTQIANRLGNPGATVADWLILTLKEASDRNIISII